MNADEPAYPTIIERDHPMGPIAVKCGGLTKREAFAMAAMQGLLAYGIDTGNYAQLASDAIKHADALLAELAKEKK